jgi:hypothetical protein
VVTWNVGEEETYNTQTGSADGVVIAALTVVVVRSTEGGNELEEVLVPRG